MFDGMTVIGTPETLDFAYTWLEAWLVSALGAEDGTEMARTCPAVIAWSLYWWAMSEAAEA